RYTRPRRASRSERSPTAASASGSMWPSPAITAPTRHRSGTRTSCVRVGSIQPRSRPSAASCGPNRSSLTHGVSVGFLRRLAKLPPAALGALRYAQGDGGVARPWPPPGPRRRSAAHVARTRGVLSGERVRRVLPEYSPARPAVLVLLRVADLDRRPDRLLPGSRDHALHPVLGVFRRGVEGRDRLHPARAT